ncbi:Hypothetical_protein [Hexamita inflata]|uniref:Hypothetical_protein n=1 Tax=Hexamita inflata TaxID=28002 RepID=A0AA86N921_9EUKA|nr:Hypothetical protein HINF_LOCUS2571 [Hexamita inflata]
MDHKKQQQKDHIEVKITGQKQNSQGQYITQNMSKHWLKAKYKYMLSTQQIMLEMNLGILQMKLEEHVNIWTQILPLVRICLHIQLRRKLIGIQEVKNCLMHTEPNLVLIS